MKNIACLWFVDDEDEEEAANVLALSFRSSSRGFVPVALWWFVTTSFKEELCFSALSKCQPPSRRHGDGIAVDVVP